MLTEGRLADSVWRVEEKDYSNAAARRPFISCMLHRVSLLLAQSGHANPGDERPSPLCPCGRFGALGFAQRGFLVSLSLFLLAPSTWSWSEDGFARYQFKIFWRQIVMSSPLETVPVHPISPVANLCCNPALKIGVVLSLGMGDATALESKQQSG